MSSRVSKKPIMVPGNVSVVLENAVLAITGPLGSLTIVSDYFDSVEKKICSNSSFFLKDLLNDSKVSSVKDVRKIDSMNGTLHANIINEIKGVSEGFKIDLEINGVGYRAELSGRNLMLNLGFSHVVVYPIPSYVDIVCTSPTRLTISGIDKQKVGQVAADIRKFRPPEPYKGKGIRYVDEIIVRKEGKKK